MIPAKALVVVDGSSDGIFGIRSGGQPAAAAGATTAGAGAVTRQYRSRANGEDREEEEDEDEEDEDDEEEGKRGGEGIEDVDARGEGLVLESGDDSWSGGGLQNDHRPRDYVAGDRDTSVRQGGVLHAWGEVGDAVSGAPSAGNRRRWGGAGAAEGVGRGGSDSSEESSHSYYPTINQGQLLEARRKRESCLCFRQGFYAGDSLTRPPPAFL